MKKYLFVFLSLIVALPFLSVKTYAISAKSAVLICGDTGEVLYSKNANERMPMASTTKIMTALVLIENADLKREITVTKEMVLVEGTSMGLKAGDTLSLYDLLYGMMLCSGNDAANAISIAVGGSKERFVGMMNEKAKDLNLKDTHFDTPSGLDGKTHYTTAAELAVITREAMKYEVFKKAVSLESVTLCYGTPKVKHTLLNHNKLLRTYDDAVGVKTGFTKKSGRCLVSAAKKDGRYVIAVTLNDGNDWQDHRELLDLGLNSVKLENIKGYASKLSVVNGEKPAKVGSSGFKFCLKSDTKTQTAVYLPMFLYSPLRKGETAGYVKVFKDGKEIKESKIKTSSEIKSVKISKKEAFFENFRLILRSINEG